MSVKTTIQDGQGTEKEACVKVPQISQENALCVNISGISQNTYISTITASGGGQFTGQLSQDGDLTTFNAAVNGTLGSPIEFRFDPLDDLDLVITELLIVGIDGSIKINNWLGSNGALTNGCILAAKVNNEVNVTNTFVKTSDLAVFSSIAGFDLLSEPAGDLVRGVKIYTPSFILRAKNTFGSGQDDYVKWTVQDSHTGIIEVNIVIRGFTVPVGSL